MANLTGWGRGTWDEGAFGEPIPVALTGVTSTGQVGTATATGVALIGVTGLSGTYCIRF
jgi:hypothetical protein